MTKNLSKNKQEIMSSVMKELGKTVHGILENYDSKENGKGERKAVNEMARTATSRAVDPKALANVRDAAQRRKYDENWAKTVKPLPRFTDFDLLHRYVAALLLFNAPCPQTEEEIDEIGIFANYAHELLDGSGTIEDIQLLYSKNDKIVARERKGSKRAIKAYRGDNMPSANFDFDKEEDNTPAPAAEPEANESEETPAYPSYDELEDNAPAEDEVKPEDIPPYDEVEDTTEEEPEEAASEEEEELLADEESETAADGEQIEKEWDSLPDITYEEYYNPLLNRSFSQINDDYLFWDADKNLIGMDVMVEDRDSKETREFKMWAPSFGKLLERFDIATEASIQNMSDKFYKVKTLPFNIRFWTAWRKYGIPNDEAEDILEDHIDDFYFKHIGNANDIDEVVKFIEEMDY
jgi:hypothetical protein